jgi:branched-chain amino acid transport system permease protein
VSAPLRRRATRALVLVAVIWPFALTSPQAHRTGTAALAAVLVACSLVVTTGWLRTITFFQPAALGTAAWVTAWLLAGGQSLPVALAGALVAGAGVALASLALAGGDPRRGLPGASLVVAAFFALLALPQATARPFPRPVLLGIDLAGERPLYLVGFAVVVGLLAAVALLRRTDVGRGLAAVGAGEDFALRCGIDLRSAWVGGLALSGALAGGAGWLLAVQARGPLDAGAYSLVAAVAVLAYPLLGGSSSLTGAAAVAVALTVLPTIGDGLLVHHTVLSGAALVLAVTLRPDGLAGLVCTARRDFWPLLAASRWESPRWRVSR